MPTDPGVASARVSRRLDEARADVAAVRTELDDWRAAWEASVGIRSHTAHLGLLAAVFDDLIGTVSSQIEAIAAGPLEDGAVYAALRDLDVPLLYVRRLWNWYSEKLDGRLAPNGTETLEQQVLLAADEVVWSVWSAVLQPITHPLPAAPLPYLAPLETPTATPPEQFPPDMRPSKDPRIEAIVNVLPIPVIGVPPAAVTRPWDLVILAHETGHQIMFALDAQGRLQQHVAAAFGDDGRAALWKPWVKECFADAVSVLAVGPSTTWSVAELEERPATGDLDHRRDYPPPIVRLALIDEVSRLVGTGRPKWLTDNASGLLARAFGGETPDEWMADVERVADALLSCDLGAGVTLRTIATSSTPGLVSGGTADGWSLDLLGAQPPSPDTRSDAARLCVAGAATAAARTGSAADRGRLATNLRAVLPECRAPATRAVAATSTVDVVAEVRLAFERELARVVA